MPRSTLYYSARTGVLGAELLEQLSTVCGLTHDELRQVFAKREARR